MLTKVLTEASLGLLLTTPSYAHNAKTACDYKESKICMETESALIDVDCQNGIAVESCSSESRIGTCVVKIQDQELVGHFYKGYPNDAKADCSEVGGVYTPASY